MGAVFEAGLLEADSFSTIFTCALKFVGEIYRNVINRSIYDYL